MISVVIPVYNEQENIRPLHERLVKVLQGMSHEIIFVDDGSTDSTVELLQSIIKENKNIKVIKLSRNFGHQAAICAGIKHVCGNTAIILDGDLQDPPETIPDFIEMWQKGHDIVYAIRVNRKEPLIKRFFYKWFYRLLSSLSKIHIPVDSGDFCLINRKVIDVLNNEMPESSKFVRGLRAYSGFNQIGIEVERDIRYAGDSKYSFRKLIKLAMDGIFDFSAFPLRLASYFGIIVSFFSFAFGVFFVLHRIFDFKVFGYSPKDVPGIATLAVGIFFLGGIIMIILGIIGEYIARIYFEVKKRPFYIVDEIISGD